MCYVSTFSNSKSIVNCYFLYHYKNLFTTDTEAPFLDLHLSIANGFVSSKIYDKREDFDFVIVNFPFLDGGVPRLYTFRNLLGSIESAIM